MSYVAKPSGTKFKIQKTGYKDGNHFGIDANCARFDSLKSSRIRVLKSLGILGTQTCSIEHSRSSCIVARLRGFGC